MLPKGEEWEDSAERTRERERLPGSREAHSCVRELRRLQSVIGASVGRGRGIGSSPETEGDHTIGSHYSVGKQICDLNKERQSHFCCVIVSGERALRSLLLSLL